MKKKILHDVYNISSRIKNIDKDYFIVFDTVKSQYEIHNKSQGKHSLCLVVPYKYLDKRTLSFVYKTQVKWASRLFVNIERNNELLNIRNNNYLVDMAKYQFNEIIKYEDKTSTNIGKYYQEFWM